MSQRVDVESQQLAGGFKTFLLKSHYIPKPFKLDHCVSSALVSPICICSNMESLCFLCPYKGLKPEANRLGALRYARLLLTFNFNQERLFVVNSGPDPVVVSVVLTGEKWQITVSKPSSS